MSRRFLKLISLLIALLALPLAGPFATRAVLGQTKTSAPASSAQKWVAPRTAWGDPDLQGWFTNLSENGTPLERPNNFAGRQLEDVKGEELTAIKRDAQKRTVESFAGPLHAPEDWWQVDLNMVKGTQAWLIIDPADG